MNSKAMCAINRGERIMIALNSAKVNSIPGNDQENIKLTSIAGCEPSCSSGADGCRENPLLFGNKLAMW